MKKNLLIKLMALVLFFVLFSLGLRLSQNKMLWNDELYSQVNGIEKLSYAAILQGKIPEGNNSPLFYILQKGLCDMTGYRLPFVWKGEWGIAEPNAQVILRLLPDFFMSLALAAVFYFFAEGYSLFAGVYAFLLAISTEICWNYWVEARPYALWFCLSMFQAVYFLRIVLGQSDQNKNWRNLGVVHVLLSLTAVFGTVQACIVSVVLYCFYRRKLSQYLLLSFVPLILGFFYFFNAPHYVFGLPPNAGSLIFENVSQERIILIAACALLAISYRFLGKQRQEPSVILHFGAVVVLIFFAAFAIMQCLKWTSQDGWKPFVISSRYFIFLAPVGVVAAAAFPLEVLKMLRVDRQKNMIIVGILLAFSCALAVQRNITAIKNFIAENPLSLNLAAQREKVKNKAMMITINHYRPDMALWKGFIIEGHPLDKSFLNDSVYYYGIISSYVPEIAEPQYMLGFCYSMLGDAQSALVAQKKAVVLEPHFFWGWYNLGVMYYHQGEFKESSQAFKKALEVNPQATVRILSASKIYGEVLRGLGASETVAQAHLQQGYYDAARMLEVSLLRYRGQPAGIDERQVQLKVF